VLVCLVSMKGIKANPDKINAIVHMKPLGSRKEVLRGSNTFEWGPEQQEAFDALKEYIQKSTNSSKSTVGSTTHFVCFGNTHCSEWSPCTIKRDIEGGQNVIAPNPNIFCFRSSVRLKEILLEDGKDMLCCGHECKEALALF
jgi:hypothetical protein